MAGAINRLDYGITGDNLRRIEAKIRQMQAAGQVIGPDTYEGLFRAELNTQADKAVERADIARKTKAEAEALAEKSREANMTYDLRQQALRNQQEQGVGNFLMQGGKIGLDYLTNKGRYPMDEKPGTGSIWENLKNSLGIGTGGAPQTASDMTSTLTNPSYDSYSYGGYPTTSYASGGGGGGDGSAFGAFSATAPDQSAEATRVTEPTVNSTTPAEPTAAPTTGAPNTNDVAMSTVDEPPSPAPTVPDVQGATANAALELGKNATTTLAGPAGGYLGGLGGDYLEKEYGIKGAGAGGRLIGGYATTEGAKAALAPSAFDLPANGVAYAAPETAGAPITEAAAADAASTAGSTAGTEAAAELGAEGAGAAAEGGTAAATGATAGLSASGIGAIIAAGMALRNNVIGPVFENGRTTMDDAANAAELNERVLRGETEHIPTYVASGGGTASWSIPYWDKIFGLDEIDNMGTPPW